MTTKRKCEACDETTTRTLSDFYLINWYAFNIGKGKAKCFCSKHYSEFKQSCYEALGNVSGQKKGE